MSAAAITLPDGLAGSLPSVLLDYQQELMVTVAENAVTVMEKGRRTGITWGIGADAVLTAAARRDAGGMDVLYIGYNLDMAREFIDTCAMWARSFARGVGEIGEPDEVLFTEDNGQGGTREIRAFCISFASGFEIMALSSRPRSLRGRQGKVIVDEAGFHEDLAELLKAALALLIWGGKVVVISTHNGADNPFNQLVEDVRSKRLPYALLRLTFDDALRQGLYERICLVKGDTWSAEAEAAWRADIIAFYGAGADEELHVIPSQGSGAFLPGVLVESRMVVDRPVLRWSCAPDFALRAEPDRAQACDDWIQAVLAPELAAIAADPEPIARSHVGGDFGRYGDLTVFFPFLVRRNLLREAPFAIELRRCPFAQQRQILFFLLCGLPRFGSAALDRGGLGMQLAEETADEFGHGRVHQVALTVDWYREHMPPYKRAFEDGALTLPKDADILADHRALVMVKGVVRVPDKHTTGADKGKRHADAAVAGALAWFATETDLPAAGESVEAAADAYRSERHRGGAVMGDRRPGGLFGRWQ